MPPTKGNTRMTHSTNKNPFAKTERGLDRRNARRNARIHKQMFFNQVLKGV